MSRRKPALAVVAPDAALYPHIRWFIRRDICSVLRIEKYAFKNAWTENDFIMTLRNRDVIGMVAEVDCVIVGYMLYQLRKTRLDLLNFAVDPAKHRRGIGRAMHAKLAGKLSPHRRTMIALTVRESNLPAQLFWRSCGYKAVDVVRGFYSDTGEDAYRMEYRLPVPTETLQLVGN